MMTQPAPQAPVSWGRMTMFETPACWHAFIDHPGEHRLLVRGNSFGNLAAEAGRAVGARMHGKAIPKPTEAWRSIEVQASGREAVLRKWVNELIALARRERWAPVECEVLEVDDAGLRARLRGQMLAQAPGLLKAAIRPGCHLAPDGSELVAEVILKDSSASARSARS